MIDIHGERDHETWESCPDLNCCACECTTCKRAWWAVGRPSPKDCPVHNPKHQPGGDDVAMTNEKILQAVRACEQRLRQYYPEAHAKKISDDEPPRAFVTHSRHLIYMCQEIPKLLIDGRREKVMRWLGFLQGAMWESGVANLSELKRMNMPDVEK